MASADPAPTDTTLTPTPTNTFTDTTPTNTFTDATSTDTTDTPLTWKGLFATHYVVDRRWATGRVTAKALSGHKDSVYCTHYNESLIVTGSRDNTIKVWDAERGTLIKTLGVAPARGTEPEQTTVNEAGAANVTATTNNTNTNNTTNTTNITTTAPFFHTGSIISVHFDDTLLVTGSSDSTFIVWDLKSLEGILTVAHHTNGILGVAVTPSYIVTCSKDSTICIWDRCGCCPGNPQLPLLGTLQGHRGPVNAVQALGEFVVSAGGDGLVRLWSLTGGGLPFEADTGEEDGELRRDASECASIATAAPLTFNPVCLRTFRGHTRGLACVRVYPNLKTVISGGNDNTIRLWDVSSGRCLKVLEGHRELVRSLDVCGGRIVSGSYDQTIKVWDAETGELVVELSGWFGSWIFTAKASATRIVATSFGIKPVILDFGEGLEKRYLDMIV